MKCRVLVLGVLLCIGLRSSLAAGPKDKETKADMLGAKNVFIGWVNLSPDEWSEWGYESKDEWTEVIKELNTEFQKDCQSKYLSDRRVAVARDKNDEDLTGDDLYIKFSDVSIDRSYYGIRASIHFIDPKTNTELGVIPARTYYEKRWFKFQLYMQAALDEIGKKIQIEVMGTAPGK